MQSPIIVFDHLKKVVAAIPSGPAADTDQTLAEVAAAQGAQTSTASGLPPRP